MAPDCYRLEGVVQSPGVAEFKERWPALFEPFQINEEFHMCTVVPLESPCMSQLDRDTPKLLQLFSAKGGAVGQRIKYMLTEGTAERSVHQELKTRSVRIYTCQEPDAAGVIIEGVPMLTGLESLEFELVNC